jgi:hypothetical protein
MNFFKDIQIIIISIELFFIIFHGFILIKVQYAQKESNINVPKMGHIISIFIFLAMIACSTFFLFTLR